MFVIMTLSQIAKIKSDKLGRIWVTNGERTYHIPQYELDKYIQNGFIKGRKLLGSEKKEKKIINYS